MKKFLLLVVFYFFFNPIAANSQSFFQEEYPKVWKRAANYSIAVAEAMPEDLYDLKVHPEAMSFKEQQLHMVTNISFLTRLISDEKRTFYDRENINDLSKKEVLGILETSFSYVAALIESMEAEEVSQKIEFNNESISKKNIFYLLRDHMTHHRGQSVIYLRIKNIDIPEYIGW
ncbi:DinB family protein [Christiangramia echinicola]|uniref:Uncharacterized damage-inducible protein DinB (Forms a four-helix bundle) n=1 Tax=Christiangramia echinicola TaxID=279359 RepID=A0A1H1SEF9_9FLAO|nr:DinB family protein [Christiangramia echinicola]SDS46116.1 Uncharacterized damage-inducible protein DinB (forms a four-helix bundle) [Christiangramia echinicola]